MAQGTRKSVWEVAFHPLTGRHLSYDPEIVYEYKDGVRTAHDTLHVVPDFEFDATMRFRRFERGRSSVTAIFESTERFTGGYVSEYESVPVPITREWSMFLAEFERLVPYLKEGIIYGRWGFTKNGANTGIIRLP